MLFIQHLWQGENEDGLLALASDFSKEELIQADSYTYDTLSELVNYVPWSVCNGNQQG